jgi:hypothetical protein
MRSQVPDGDIAAIVGKAVKELRQRLDARRFAQTKSSRKPIARRDSGSRDLSAEVQRFVYDRDGGQCRFVDAEGRRCPERHDLEYHHDDGFALGGSGEPDNILLMCHAHNQYLAELVYGRKKMSRYRRWAPAPSPSDRKEGSSQTNGDVVTDIPIPGGVDAGANCLAIGATTTGSTETDERT